MPTDFSRSSDMIMCIGKTAEDTREKKYDKSRSASAAPGLLKVISLTRKTIFL